MQDHIAIQFVWCVHVIHNRPLGEICLESLFAVINYIAVRVCYLPLMSLLIMHTYTDILTANHGIYAFFPVSRNFHQHGSSWNHCVTSAVLSDVMSRYGYSAGFHFLPVLYIIYQL